MQPLVKRPRVATSCVASSTSVGVELRVVCDVLVDVTDSTAPVVKESLLASGTYARVYSATRGDAPCALKRYKEADGKSGLVFDAVREVTALRQSGAHPGVVQWEAVWPPHEPSPALCMPLAQGTLWTLLRTKPREWLRERAARAHAQLWSALGHLHGRRVAHRDLKPNNVLVYDGLHLRVADFGAACVVPASGRCIDQCCTYQYAPPEMLVGDLQSPSLDAVERAAYDPLAVDVWSLGMIVGEMLNGGVLVDWTPVTSLREDPTPHDYCLFWKLSGNHEHARGRLADEYKPLLAWNPSARPRTSDVKGKDAAVDARDDDAWKGICLDGRRGIRRNMALVASHMRLGTTGEDVVDAALNLMDAFVRREAARDKRRLTTERVDTYALAAFMLASKSVGEVFVTDWKETIMRLKGRDEHVANAVFRAERKLARALLDA